MLLAIAALAVQAQAANSVTGLGYQLKWDGDVSAGMDYHYVTVYSMSAETLKNLMDLDYTPTWDNVTAVQNWLTAYQVDCRDFKAAANQWENEKLSKWLTGTSTSTSANYFTARLPAEEGVSVSDTIEANKWIVAFYDASGDGTIDKLRIAYPIWDESDTAVTAIEGNAQDLTTDSFVVRGSKSTKFLPSWVDVSPVDIPEPTSGMLLLLGVAGLALKRKRA